MRTKFRSRSLRNVRLHTIVPMDSPYEGGETIKLDFIKEFPWDFKPVPSPPLKVRDQEGNVTMFAHRLVPNDPKDPSKGFWLKTRETLNEDFKMKDHDGDNYWFVADENKHQFMKLNDISLGDFKGGMPRNLHLWAERPGLWVPSKHQKCNCDICRPWLV